MHRHNLAKLIDVSLTSMASLETEWVIKVIVEESAKHVKWVEIEFLNGIWHWNITLLVQIFVGEGDSTSLIADDISTEVDQVAILVYSATSAILSLFAIEACKNKISTVVPIKVTDNVNFIESSSLI